MKLLHLVIESGQSIIIMAKQSLEEKIVSRSSISRAGENMDKIALPSMRTE